MSAVVVALLASAMRGECLSLADATLLEDSGLEGDRHARRHSRRQVLVVEEEVLNEFGLAHGAIREQVTVRGLALDGLVLGARLRVGGALLEVAGPCDPCARMDELRPGLQRSLEGRRGRFVRVVQAGSFAVGDAIQVEPPA